MSDDLRQRTRRVLAIAICAPVAFVLAYPWLCCLLPSRVEEWTDLPRDLIGFLVVDAVVTAVALGGRGEGVIRPAILLTTAAFLVAFET